LPAVWSPSVISYPANAWDGTHALVNGPSMTWAFPYAASFDLEFDPPRLGVGMGLSNFQHDASSGNTYHTVTVNGVAMGQLESMAHWTSTVAGKTLYLFVTGDSGTPIQSIVITADPHYDGMVVDELAFGELAVPTTASTWGQIKALFR
jgi:hypothetical protein